MMPAQQANRQGRPWQRKSDGRWCVRAYPPGSAPKMVYGKTEDEVLAKQAKAEAAAPEAAGAGPYLCPRCAAGDHCHGDETCLCKCGKTTRITLDMSPQLYRQLNRWLASAAIETDRRVSLAAGLRAMVKVVTLDPMVSTMVTSELRERRS